jgi:hypothetical protein
LGSTGLVEILDFGNFPRFTFPVKDGGTLLSFLILQRQYASGHEKNKENGEETWVGSCNNTFPGKVEGTLMKLDTLESGVSRDL